MNKSPFEVRNEKECYFNGKNKIFSQEGIYNLGININKTTDKEIIVNCPKER